MLRLKFERKKVKEVVQIRVVKIKGESVLLRVGDEVFWLLPGDAVVVRP